MQTNESLKIEVGKKYFVEAGYIIQIDDEIEEGLYVGLFRINNNEFSDQFAQHEILREATWRDLIPWEAIHPKWQWIAWDTNADRLSPILFTVKPIVDGNYWNLEDRDSGDAGYDIEGIFILPTPDCPWYETATERPKK